MVPKTAVLVLPPLEQERTKLVAGAGAYICDKCAYETIRIMEATPPAESTPDARATVLHKRASDSHHTWHFATNDPQLLTRSR